MNREELSPGITAALFLPKEILSNIPEGSDVRLAFTVYNEATLFPVRETTQMQFANDTTTEVGSQVVSVIVADIPDGTKLNAPIAYSLSQSRTITLEADEYISERICVFWNFTAASELNYTR